MKRDGHTNILSSFGRVVRRRRMELGLSQEAFAERAELHRTYLADIERGTRNVSLRNICKLAEALDLSISELFADFKKDLRK